MLAILSVPLHIEIEPKLCPFTFPKSSVEPDSIVKLLEEAAAGVVTV